MQQKIKLPPQLSATVVAALSPGIRVQTYATLHFSKINLKIFLYGYLTLIFFFLESLYLIIFLHFKKITFHAENTVYKGKVNR